MIKEDKEHGRKNAFKVIIKTICFWTWGLEEFEINCKSTLKTRPNEEFESNPPSKEHNQSLELSAE